MMSAKIKSLCALRGITQAELAEELNISQPVLSRKMKLDNWREDDLQKIAKILDMEYKSDFVPKDN